jgi:hypothetical protein
MLAVPGNSGNSYVARYKNPFPAFPPLLGTNTTLGPPAFLFPLQVGTMGTLSKAEALFVPTVPGNKEGWLLLMDDVTKILHRLREVAGLPERSTTQDGEVTPSARMKSRVLVRPELKPQVERVTEWAGEDPKRWQKLHSTLLRIYSPFWVSDEARCLLVAWVAAWLALSRAKRDLAHLGNLRRPLTRGERAAEAARHADISFWGRLIRHLDPQIPGVLAQDRETIALLARLVSGKGDSDQ